MASIKEQVEELENKIEEYGKLVEIQEVEDEFPVDAPVAETIAEPVETELVEEVLEDVMDIELEPSDDLPFYDDLPVSEPEIEPEAESETELETESEPMAEAEPIPVIDAMIAKQPWRTDMPGSPVRDIRSAISLNDRILFINYLFGEDPMAFQEMLTQLNAMSSFDEAAAHAIAAHPEWNLESDTVYRFMMALRRRHQ